MRVLVITPWANGFAGEQISMLRKAPGLSVEVMALRNVDGPKIAVLISAIWQAIWACHSRPDVIHAYSAWPAGIVGVWLRKFGFETRPSLVVHEHLGPPERLCELPFAVAALKSADRVVSPSQKHARDVGRIVSRAVEVVANPVVIPPSRPLVLCVGRLSLEKGFDYVVGEVARSLRDISFLVIGDGPEYVRLKSMSSENVSFLRGDVGKDVLHKIMGCASVVVCPSRYESFGLVAAEARAMGIPVVASEAAGGRATCVEEIAVEIKKAICHTRPVKEVTSNTFVSDMTEQYVSVRKPTWEEFDKWPG
jgi:glycosyltransferase involved in cell wall biosynthesis